MVKRLESFLSGNPEVYLCICCFLLSVAFRSSREGRVQWRERKHLYHLNKCMYTSLRIMNVKTSQRKHLYLLHKRFILYAKAGWELPWNWGRFNPSFAVVTPSSFLVMHPSCASKLQENLSVAGLCPGPCWRSTALPMTPWPPSWWGGGWLTSEPDPCSLLFRPQASAADLRIYFSQFSPYSKAYT